jgi:hypothetical protein
LPSYIVSRGDFRGETILPLSEVPEARQSRGRVSGIVIVPRRDGSWDACPALIAIRLREIDSGSPVMPSGAAGANCRDLSAETRQSRFFIAWANDSSFSMYKSWE